jgi:hypothetical protein
MNGGNDGARASIETGRRSGPMALVRSMVLAMVLAYGLTTVAIDGSHGFGTRSYRLR